jgi:hypothetical protein
MSAGGALIRRLTAGLPGKKQLVVVSEESGDRSAYAWF